MARKKLAGVRRAAADENDVVQEAFDAFFRAAAAGRLTLLHDRDDLWRLLVKIAENKVRDQRRRERTSKRGGGMVRGESAFAGEPGEGPAGFDQTIGPEPTPEFAAQAAEEFRRLLAVLGDPQLEKIVLMKMAGHTHEEVAQELGCVPDTVGRKLRRIRSRWSREVVNE
jgi:RNA polymerase sigma factor (sigma-70 family)